jgi:hypothetical protein
MDLCRVSVAGLSTQQPDTEKVIADANHGISDYLADLPLCQSVVGCSADMSSKLLGAVENHEDGYVKKTSLPASPVGGPSQLPQHTPVTYSCPGFSDGSELLARAVST